MEEPNPPENRNINTGGGNYNERIEGDYIQGNVFQNIFNILGGQQTTPVGNPARPKNQRILLAAVKEEVAARLRQSLHNAVLINLGKESQPQQVKRPWDAEIKIGLKPAVPLSDTTTILEVFDSQEIAGKLLILGVPGSGKTTTQLELAQELIKRAEEQPDYPVPVLFNLSSWKDDRQSITDWLVAELKSKYGVSNKLGKEWVDNQQLLPLLDGLDELEPQRQEICVQGINQFLAGETRPLSLIVCSRSEEYSNYSTQLQLNGAIYLQPLTNNQICDYLTSIKRRELWLIISSDLDLLELVKTPLLLSITVLVSQEISVEEWQHLNSTPDRIQYLLDAYVGRMLTRDTNSRTYLKNKTPNARQTRMWLVWLAQQMQRESKTEFLIEKMQPALLLTPPEKWIYRLMLGFFSGLPVSFSIVPLIQTTIGFQLELFIIVFFSYFGLVFCFNWKEIETYPIIEFNWKKSKKRIIVWGISGILFGLYVALILNSLLGLSFGIFLGFILGLDSYDIEVQKIPNQGIRNTLINAGVIGIILGTISVLHFMSIFGFTIGLSIGLIMAIVGWLGRGGRICIQHLILRLMLYRKGYIPWNYARFLDYCTERLFLQRVGGRYRFIHKLLQDHFAQMEFKRN